MKCRICGEEIILVPSARYRAEKYGGQAADYTRLFTTHTDCALAERQMSVRALMKELH